MVPLRLRAAAQGLRQTLDSCGACIGPPPAAAFMACAEVLAIAALLPVVLTGGAPWVWTWRSRKVCWPGASPTPLRRRCAAPPFRHFQSDQWWCTALGKRHRGYPVEYVRCGSHVPPRGYLRCSDGNRVARLAYESSSHSARTRFIKTCRTANLSSRASVTGKRRCAAQGGGFACASPRVPPQRRPLPRCYPFRGIIQPNPPGNRTRWLLREYKRWKMPGVLISGLWDDSASALVVAGATGGIPMLAVFTAYERPESSIRGLRLAVLPMARWLLKGVVPRSWCRTRMIRR